MGLAAGLHVLQFDRLFELGAVGDVDEIAVGDEGGVQRADRIVAAVGIERRRDAAVGELFRQALNGDAFDRRAASVATRRSAPAGRRSLRRSARRPWRWPSASKSGTDVSSRRRSV